LSKNSPSPHSSENNSAKEDLSFRSVESHPISSEKMSIVISDVVREVAAPLIEKWLEKNLASLVKEVVTAEVQKVVKQS
jgi:cell pole-organizing protein PopZ